MDNTQSPNLFLGREFAIIQSGSGIIKCVNVGSSDGECLSLMGETKVAFLVLVIDV